MPFGATLTYEQDAKDARKARGAFFTPEELAAQLVVAAIEVPSARVFEPSCGEACFLEQAAHRLHALGASDSQISKQLFGCELHEESAAAARRRLRHMGVSAHIATADFFDLDAEAEFDAIVGNPPYIRYQDFNGPSREKALKRAAQSGVELSSLCSSWAPFLSVCISLLASGGNLGMVLPAELLTVGYAAPVRRALLSSFAAIEVTMFEERVFPEVQEEVVLLVARKKGGACGGHIDLRRMEGLGGREAVYRGRVGVRTDGSRWSELLSAGSALTGVAQSGFCALGEWGRVSLGAVTGDNRFFTLTDAEAARLGIGEADCVKIVPPGSRHLRSLVYGPQEEAACAATGMPTRLFRPEPGAMSGDVLAYIAEGELRGVDGRYKCRVRKPWWRVPLPARPADLLFTYMNDVAPQLCDNQSGAFHLNSVHGVFLCDELRALGKELLPIACLNSLTSLSAELEGRQYGGGLLKMEPREATSLKVPSPSLVEGVAEALRSARPAVLEALEGGGFHRASELVDKIVLVEGEGMPPADAKAIRDAAGALTARRRSRAKSPGRN